MFAVLLLLAETCLFPQKGITRTAQLPPNRQYDTGWVIQRIPLGEEVQALSYHEEQDAYVLGTITPVDFKLPEDDFHYQWSEEGDTFKKDVTIYTSLTGAHRYEISPTNRSRLT